MPIEVCTGNNHIDEDTELFFEALSRDNEIVLERLKTLSMMLTNQSLKHSSVKK